MQLSALKALFIPKSINDSLSRGVDVVALEFQFRTWKDYFYVPEVRFVPGWYFLISALICATSGLNIFSP